MVFPPLTEIGDNMTANVVGWCERRKVRMLLRFVMLLRISSFTFLSRHDTIHKTEVCAGTAGPEEQATELAKLDERIAKFRDKMAFMDELKRIKKRKSLS